MSTPVISNNFLPEVLNSFFLFKHLCESCTMDFDLTSTTLTTSHTIMKQDNEILSQMSVNTLSTVCVVENGQM